MLTIEELEEQSRQPKESAEAEVSSPVEDLQVDFQDALVLLRKARTVMNYVSDPDLCKALTKEKRASLEKLAGMVNDYLENISLSYGEV